MDFAKLVDLLDRKSVTFVSATQQFEGLTDRYVARLLDLAFLPPALVEEILGGRQPP